MNAILLFDDIFADGKLEIQLRGGQSRQIDIHVPHEVRKLPVLHTRNTILYRLKMDFFFHCLCSLTVEQLGLESGCPPPSRVKIEQPIKSFVNCIPVSQSRKKARKRPRIICEERAAVLTNASKSRKQLLN